MGDTWPKVIVTAGAAPLALLLLSTLLIPGIIEDANKSAASRTAKLKKALDIGDQNRDFTSRLNVLKTRMHMFNEQNARRNFSPMELRNSQNSFQKEHTDDYLALDKIAWWWYWDLEREGEISELLSAKELSGLHALLDEYGKNAEASVSAITPVWHLLSSSQYNLRNDCQKRIELLELEANTKLDELSKVRIQIVKDIAACFAQSKCVSSQRRTPQSGTTK